MLLILNWSRRGCNMRAIQLEELWIQRIGSETPEPNECHIDHWNGRDGRLCTLTCFIGKGEKGLVSDCPPAACTHCRPSYTFLFFYIEEALRQKAMAAAAQMPPPKKPDEPVKQDVPEEKPKFPGAGFRLKGGVVAPSTPGSTTTTTTASTTASTPTKPQTPTTQKAQLSASQSNIPKPSPAAPQNVMRSSTGGMMFGSAPKKPEEKKPAAAPEPAPTEKKPTFVAFSGQGFSLKGDKSKGKEKNWGNFYHPRTKEGRGGRRGSDLVCRFVAIFFLLQLLEVLLPSPPPHHTRLLYTGGRFVESEEEMWGKGCGIGRECWANNQPIWRIGTLGMW